MSVGVINLYINGQSLSADSSISKLVEQSQNYLAIRLIPDQTWETYSEISVMFTHEDEINDIEVKAAFDDGNYVLMLVPKEVIKMPGFGIYLVAKTIAGEIITTHPLYFKLDVTGKQVTPTGSETGVGVAIVKAAIEENNRQKIKKIEDEELPDIREDIADLERELVQAKEDCNDYTDEQVKLVEESTQETISNLSTYLASENLCDNEWEYGLIDKYGLEYADATRGYRSKNYLPVEGGQPIYQNNSTGTGYMIFQYKEDKTFISYDSLNQAGITSEGVLWNNKIELDADTKYIRIHKETSSLIDLSTIQVNVLYKEDAEKIVSPDGVFKYIEPFIRSKDILDEIEKNKVIVEKTYDATSTNAISGKAVAEAITDLSSEVSNAIKGIVKGNTIQINDVSPLEHDVVVRVDNKNLVKSISVKTSEQAKGKEVLSVTADLKPNTTYTISFVGTSGHRIYFNEAVFSTSHYDTAELDGSRQSFVITTKPNIDENNTTWVIAKNRVDTTLIPSFSNVQIELGNTATPYIDFTTFTITEEITGTTYSVDTNGICDIPSVSPTMKFSTNNTNAMIECEYSRDVNIFVNQTLNKLNDVSNSVKSISRATIVKINSDPLEYSSIQIDDVSPLAHDVVVRVERKNLAESYTNGTESKGYSGCLYVKANLKPSTTYTISFVGELGHKVYCNEALFTEHPEAVLTNNRQTFTVTTKDNISTSNSNMYSSTSGWIILKNNKSNTVTPNFSDVQIELGDTATEYTPYVDLIDIKVKDVITQELYPLNVNGFCIIPSAMSTIELSMNTAGIIECEYNKDINSAVKIEHSYNPSSKNSISGIGISTIVNNVSNAVKGIAQGVNIQIDDISPIEHNVVAKAYSKNLVEDFMVSTKVSEYTNALTIIANLQPNTTYTISFDDTPGHKIYFNENMFVDTYHSLFQENGLWDKADTERYAFVVTTRPDIDKNNKNWILIKNNKGNTVTPNFSDVQIELGDTATEYTPYVDPATIIIKEEVTDITYTTNKDGICNIPSNSPIMKFSSSVDGVIQCEYNKDINTVITEMRTALSNTGTQNILKGKKIVYDGDSICAPWRDPSQNIDNGGAYPRLIAELVNGTSAATEYYDNQAVGGGVFRTQLDIEEKKRRHSIVDNLVKLPTDGDLYCFEGGVNDHWSQTTLGDFIVDDYTGTLETTTFCGALEAVFRYCIENFIGKPICFIITHKCADQGEINEHTFADFREKMIGICEKYSIPYYDAWKESGLNYWNEAHCESNFIIREGHPKGDKCHPNIEGYKRYYVPQLISLFERIMPR